jgi:hypothetical protein
MWVTNWPQGSHFHVKPDRFVEVFVVTSVVEAGQERICKVVQRPMPFWVTDWPQGPCFPVKHDDFVEVFVVTSVVEAGGERNCKIIQ